MLRPLYRCLLRLHPRTFRQRYGEEMLWIFDESTSATDRASLLIDGLVSLIRQCLARPANWEKAEVVSPAVRSANGVPLFQTVEITAPRSTALLNGMLLSLGVFSALAVVISHGRTSGSLQLPRVIVVPENIPPEDIPALPVIDPPDTGPHEEVVSPGGPVNSGFKRSDAQVRMQAADLERIIALQRTHVVVAAPAARVRKRPIASRRTTPLPTETNPMPQPNTWDDAVRQAGALLSLLDQDGDGSLSLDESAEGPERLRDFLVHADQNRDQVITLDELREAMSGSLGPLTVQPSSADMN
jgi:hypothetical protein